MCLKKLRKIGESSVLHFLGSVTVTCHPRLYGVSCLYGGQKEGPHYGQGKNWAPTSIRMAFI